MSDKVKGPLETLAELLGFDPAMGDAATPDVVMQRVQQALPEGLRERTDVEQLGVGRRPYVKPAVKGAGRAGPRMPWESPRSQLDNQQTADVLGDLFMGEGRPVSNGAAPSIARKHDAVFAADGDPLVRVSRAAADNHYRANRHATAPADAPFQQPWQDPTTKNPWRGRNALGSRAADNDFWGETRAGGVGKDSTNVAGYLTDNQLAKRERFMTTQQQALADAPRGVPEPDLAAWAELMKKYGLL